MFNHEKDLGQNSLFHLALHALLLLSLNLFIPNLEDAFSPLCGLAIKYMGPLLILGYIPRALLRKILYVVVIPLEVGYTAYNFKYNAGVSLENLTKIRCCHKARILILLIDSNRIFFPFHSTNVR